MAAKRHISHSNSRPHRVGEAHKEDARKRRQTMRVLLGVLGQSLPVQQSALQSVLLLHFHRAAKDTIPKGQAELALNGLSGILNPLARLRRV